MFAYFLGNFLSLNKIYDLALIWPSLPPLLQAFNLVLIYICSKAELITDLYVYFFWTMWVGMQSGTCYTSWCYLACTKFNKVKGHEFDL
jgi:hypothetical protein